MATIILPGGKRGLRERLSRVHWPLIILLTMVAGAGVVTLYSAAEGSWQPWALKHLIRFAVSLCLLLVMAMVAMRHWMTLAYPVYFFALAALAAVPFIGVVNMGAQRWIEVGGFQFQPSELMKLALVLGLARYYHGLRAEQVSQPLYLVPPLVMIGAPVALVFMQPDLGTAILIGATGAAIVFLAGLSWRIGIIGVIGAFVAGVAAYRFGILKQYQVERILTFLDPDRDPLGKGYHLLQSKIALGSGGLDGKGYMLGTQSQLKFLPEMQTDFIFTIFGEEFGFVGAIGLLLLYYAVIMIGINIALGAKTHFARLASLGVIVTFSLYVLINTGMVMGLAPVVGVPLPLVSYGGTVMLTIMAGFGLLMSAYVSREQDAFSGRGSL
ncbi:rod shape-determining protein RodA [Amphiplicatus metriothermophilus]|uniref:Peptidoglycan glycosyltransferase MrdB n=1 Tax=Amphiplicatus metriothermophilus TaxID=1519374 RepID=A0A239PQP9_9PROT|nr:rod shape-determining protein RodA [Amphiplicatus metriothermophilus]MBB5518375.1 rod shape determining protein RodA [Amphiplicatus metriothermophilus]SNT72458.1 cell elongation-specific peptidoglycan biosynthesis regulator RodA [Amphiplicatus metriothermophilus]